MKDEAGDQVGNHSITRRSSRNSGQNTYSIACSNESIFSKTNVAVVLNGGVKLKILTIGIRQHQGQDEKYRKSPPRQLETALVKGQERHADREDEHDCIPVSRHLGVSAHDLEVGIVVFDVTTGETGDSDLPGTTAVVAQLLWWIRLLVVHFHNATSRFFWGFIFCFFKHCKNKKDIPQMRLWPRYSSSPRRNGRYTTEPTVIDNTRSEARIFFFHPQDEFFLARTLT